MKYDMNEKQEVVRVDENKKEFIVWGIPPKKKYEEILYTKAKSLKEAEKICNLLESNHGCTKCRVQILDLSSKPDFTKVF